MIKYTVYSLQKRITASLLVIVFAALSLCIRLFWVQVITGKSLTLRAAEQWARDLPVIPERGLITDANGEILAGNRSVYSVYVRPKAVTDLTAVAQLLSDTLELSVDSLTERLSNKSVSEVTVKRRVEKEVADRIIAANCNGVYLSRDNLRVYPYADLLSQVLGFVNVDNRGQSGLESYYDLFLRGTEGKVLTQTDLQGVAISGAEQMYLPAISGMTLTLTIDAKIQMIAERAMEQAMRTHSPIGARCIVMDPNTGAILAMVNKPSLDLNDLPRDDISLLNQYSRNALVVDIYEPGSTFKIFTACANIEEYQNGNRNALAPTHIFPDSRTRTVEGSTVKCWSMHLNGNHSHQTLSDALNNSCNPCFVDIALSLGKSTFYQYLSKFGFGKQTGIDFIGEQGGILLAEPLVKNGDLARIGFGQTVAVTPLQLISATCAAVNGGNYYQPYLVSEISSAEGDTVSRFYPTLKNRAISEKTSQTIRAMLEGVVRDGSGKHAYIEGYRVGGKTGTAQKYENGIIAQGKYISSFVGFFPANAPQYAALIIIDEPEGAHYGSTVAAPYCREIFEQIIALKRMKGDA